MGLRRRLERWLVSLFPDDLHQHPLRPAAVELAVEDLLPRAEVELALGDGHDDLPAHDLPLHVGVGVVLAGAVVVVGFGRRVERGQLLQPLLVVVVQARLVVVDEDAMAVMCIALTSTSPSWTPLLLDDLLDLRA